MQSNIRYQIIFAMTNSKLWSIDEAEQAADEAVVVSHGIGDACRRSFFSRSLGELDLFLDTMTVPVPVLAMDNDAVVSYANEAARALLAKDLPAVRGFRNGDVFECVNARLPGGCGKTEQCRGCRLRLTVEETFATGSGRQRVPALLTRIQGGKTETVQALISTEKNGSLVLLRIDELTDVE
jgi:hypothetical protein